MPDPIDIPGWYRLDDRLTSSGQPSEEQLGALSVIGVKHIVNLGLHTHERALPDEAASVSALGMAYIHIPVEFDAPTEGDFKRFCAVMRELIDQPVHVHCIVNARVSAFLYRYRRDVLGVPETVAREAMEKIWSPGGVWAAFIGDETSVEKPHRYYLRAG
jgi:protein tyrosine phosphatase (PTP) superfamily phosphohydrolase (DUF442 family)